MAITKERESVRQLATYYICVKGGTCVTCLSYRLARDCCCNERHKESEQSLHPLAEGTTSIQNPWFPTGRGNHQHPELLVLHRQREPPASRTPGSPQAEGSTSIQNPWFPTGRGKHQHPELLVPIHTHRQREPPASRTPQWRRNHGGSGGWRPPLFSAR